MTQYECELLQFHEWPFYFLYFKEYIKYTPSINQVIMNEPTPIRIRPKLYQEIKDEMPEIFADTTTWVNYLVQVGYNYHMGLDPCGRLGKPTDRKEKNKREVLHIPYIEENRINKEKNKKWIFKADQIHEELEFCKDLIVKFWTEKSGAKSEEAFKLLTGHYGLLGIKRKYGREDGEKAVKEQLEEAIANKWKSITLKNYEAFGRPKNADKEPVTNHPAGRVFTAAGGFE